MKLQVTIEGKAYEVEVDILGGDGEAQKTRELRAKPAAKRAAPKPARLPGRLRAKHDPLKECRSPLLGLVARVNVAPGQAVRAGDLIVVLEAMKMETPIYAPADCTIKSVEVDAGRSVRPDDLLVQFE